LRLFKTLPGRGATTGKAFGFFLTPVRIDDSEYGKEKRKGWRGASVFR